MTTKARKQTIGHAQVQPNFNAPGLVVSARNTSQAAPSVRADLSKADAYRRTSAAFSSFVPVINRIGQKLKAKDDEKEFLIGQTLGKAAGERDAAGYAEFVKENDVETHKQRIAGFNTITGAASAHRAMRSAEEFAAANGDEFQTEEQFNAVITQTYASELKGQEDPAFIAAYLTTAEGYENRMRANWHKDKFLAAQATTRDEFAAAQYHEAEQAAADGATLEEMHELYVGQRELATLSGIDNTTFNDISLMNYEQVALDTNRTDIFGGDGEEGIFHMSYAGVDDPNTLQAGLAYSAKYADQIGDTGRQISNKAVADKVKRNEMAVYNQGILMNELVGKGKFAQARRMNKQAVEDKLYSGTAAVSKDAAIRKEEALYEERLRQDQAYGLNRGATSGMTKAEQQATADRYAEAERIEAGNDIAERTQAEAVIRNKNSMNSVIDTKSKDLMKNTYFDGDMAQIQESHKTFNSYMSVSPSLTKTNIGDEAYRRQMIYKRQLSLGKTPEDAALYTSRYDTPEARQAVNTLKGSPAYYEFQADVHKELVKGRFKDSWPDSDATNEAFVAREVSEAAVQMYAVTGDLEGAIEYGTSVFEANNRFVPFPGEKAGRWVSHGGYPLPPDFAEVEQAFNDQPELRARLKLGEEDQLYFQADIYQPGSGNFVVMSTRTGQPVTAPREAGGRGAWTVHVGDLTNEYRAGMQADAEGTDEEIRAEHAASMVRKGEANVAGKKQRELHNERSKYR